MSLVVRDIWGKPYSQNQLWHIQVQINLFKMKLSKKTNHHSEMGGHGSDWWNFFLIQ